MQNHDHPPTTGSSLSDQELVERMRREEPTALQEFFARFHPMLVREARRVGVQPALRDEVVHDCLDDAALALMRHTTPIPRSLASYLAASLRHAVVDAGRARQRAEARGSRAVREGSRSGEYVVTEVCSEDSLRSSEGPDRETPPLAPALERLAVALDAALSDDERRMLGWLGEWVPQTLIAEWMGISYGAVRVRVKRLRDRLREQALAHMQRLDATEHAQLTAFFRRTVAEPREAPSPAATPDARARRRPRRSTAGRTEPCETEED